MHGCKHCDALRHVWWASNADNDWDHLEVHQLIKHMDWVLNGDSGFCISMWANEDDHLKWAEQRRDDLIKKLGL